MRAICMSSCAPSGPIRPAKQPGSLPLAAPAAMDRLQAPRGAEPRLIFSLRGSTVVDCKYLAGNGFLSSVAERGAFYGDLGAAIGLAVSQGTVSPIDIRYTFQPLATITGRPPTQLDAQLQGTMLVTVDTVYWRKQAGLPPLCCQSPDCQGTELRDKGWHRNAHSCKGNGIVHTVYVASKRRQCM